MTSLKFKHINKIFGNNKLFAMFVCAALCIAACLGWAVLGSNSASAADSPSGQIPTSTGFDPQGDTGANVPFTFWQKTESVNGQEMQDTYSYVFFPIDKNGNRIDIEQPFPGADAENPNSDPVDAKEFVFTLQGNQTKTFYIDFSKVDLLFKYKTLPYFEEDGDGWHFYYRSQMIKPDSNGQNYIYDDTYFDVKVWIPHSAIETGTKLKVFCFNPIGEKVYDPGWTIKYDQPVTPPGTPPKTVDPNWVIAITAVCIFALCIALAIADRRKRKARMQAAIDAAKNNKS